MTNQEIDEFYDKYFIAAIKAINQWKESEPRILDAQGKIVEPTPIIGEVEAHPRTIDKLLECFDKESWDDSNIDLIDNPYMSETAIGFAVFASREKGPSTRNGHPILWWA